MPLLWKGTRHKIGSFYFHLVTGDDAHYVAMVQELEALGAKVIPVFAGGLDFSKPVDAYLYEPTTKTPLVDAVISLTGFALVGGPARQDHPKAIESLKRLNRPYMVALPLVFQTTEEWMDSDLGLYHFTLSLIHLGRQGARKQRGWTISRFS